MKIIILDNRDIFILQTLCGEKLLEKPADDYRNYIEKALKKLGKQIYSQDWEKRKRGVISDPS